MYLHCDKWIISPFRKYSLYSLRGDIFIFEKRNTDTIPDGPVNDVMNVNKQVAMG